MTESLQGERGNARQERKEDRREKERDVTQPCKVSPKARNRREETSELKSRKDSIRVKRERERERKEKGHLGRMEVEEGT